MKWKTIVAGILVSVALATGYFFVQVEPVAQAQGWLNDPEAVPAIQAEFGLADFSDTPAGHAVMDDQDNVYLWKAVEEVTGSPAKVHNQNPVGSCVSFGTARALEKSLAVQIKLGDRYRFEYLCEENIYGGSRVEVAGGVLRNADGSRGVWAAQWVAHKGGAIPRGVYEAGGKTYDLTAYNPTLCRQWGFYGVPDPLEPEVRTFKTGDAALVRSWAEAKKALGQGYGVAICSDQGFSSQRNANGVAQAQGTWNHCMCLDGFHREDGKEYGHIENSWGAVYHRGPVGFGNPPESGFWAESSVVDRMLRQGDSWAFSAVKGFPKRKINWFAMAKRDKVLAKNGKNDTIDRMKPFLAVTNRGGS
jgi:hypothetical protein